MDIIDYLYDSDYEDNNNLSDNENMLLFSCKEGNIYLIQWILFNTDITLTLKKESMFYIASEFNQIETVKFIYNIYPNMNISNQINKLLLIICEEGYFDLLLWIYSKYKNLIDSISKLNKYNLFFKACTFFNLDIAEWLILIDSDIPVYLENNFLFKHACRRNEIDLALLLVNIRKDCYYINIIDDKIQHYEIINDLSIKNTISRENIEIENCYICYENNANIYTVCGHYYCYECIKKHYEINDLKCPYCRKENYEYELFKIV